MERLIVGVAVHPDDDVFGVLIGQHITRMQTLVDGTKVLTEVPIVSDLTTTPGRWEYIYEGTQLAITHGLEDKLF